MKRVICIRLFDCHCDTLERGLDCRCSLSENDGAVDLCRGSVFSPWVQAFAAFIPDTLRDECAQRHCAKLLDTAGRWERECDGFRIVRSLEDLTECPAVCHALLTGENIGALGDVCLLNRLRECGMRAATLTWNGDNPWGSGCFGDDRGLSALGNSAVERMQTLGIVVDVSHLNERGFWDVARRAKRPFIASHSNSAAVMPHPRNLTDDQFRAIRDIGGIVGMNLYHAHLGIPFDGDYLAAFTRHLIHFLSLDGEDTVCIGTDFDGMMMPPEYNGMAMLRQLYEYLQSRGLSAAVIDKVFYTNACRFFTEAIA